MVVAFPAVGTLFPAQTGDALKVPGAFKHWRLVHSTLIAKDDNKLDLIAGGHHRPASICVGEANDAERFAHALKGIINKRLTYTALTGSELPQT